MDSHLHEAPKPHAVPHSLTRDGIGNPLPLSGSVTVNSSVTRRLEAIRHCIAGSRPGSVLGGHRHGTIFQLGSVNPGPCSDWREKLEMSQLSHRRRSYRTTMASYCYRPALHMRKCPSITMCRPPVRIQKPMFPQASIRGVIRAALVETRSVSC